MKLEKVLKRTGMKGEMEGFFLKTYREGNTMSLKNDEVVVLLKKAMFKDGEYPDMISVTVEWNE